MTDVESRSPVSGPSVSIIVCTCDRPDSLRQTLKALDRLTIPPAWMVELVLVDNAPAASSTVAREAVLSKIDVRYVRETRKGLSRARNAGLARARGDFVLFTDDDALPAEDWLELMVAALTADGYDAVTGRFMPAVHLTRPWATPMHRWWLGDSEAARTRAGTREMIGGNMGFRRSVLERVRAFDPELGAGALGFGEDSLFGWQLARAGFRIAYIPAARVTHEFDASRLRRAQWLDAARKRGQSEAYVRYHWEHAPIRVPRLKSLLYFAALHVRRLLQPPPAPESEGCPLWEMSYVMHMQMCRRYCIERQRPPNYAKWGLARSARVVEP